MGLKGVIGFGQKGVFRVTVNPPSHHMCAQVHPCGRGAALGIWPVISKLCLCPQARERNEESFPSNKNAVAHMYMDDYLAIKKEENLLFCDSLDRLRGYYTK